MPLVSRTGSQLRSVPDSAEEPACLPAMPALFRLALQGNIDTSSFPSLPPLLLLLLPVRSLLDNIPSINEQAGAVGDTADGA